MTDQAQEQEDVVIKATFYEEQLSDDTIRLLRTFISNDTFMSEEDAYHLGALLVEQIGREADTFIAKVFAEEVIKPRLRLYHEH